MKTIKFTVLALGAIVLAIAPAAADGIVPAPEAPLEFAFKIEVPGVPLPPVRPASLRAQAVALHAVRLPEAVAKRRPPAAATHAAAPARPAPAAFPLVAAIAQPPVPVREARNCTTVQCISSLVIGVGF